MYSVNGIFDFLRSQSKIVCPFLKEKALNELINH